MAPARIGGYKPRVLSGATADWLRMWMRDHPFTLRGLAKELAERGVRVDYRSVWQFAHDEALKFKKNRVRQRTGAPSHVARRRRLWKARQGRIDARRLVFIDET